MGREGGGLYTSADFCFNICSSRRDKTQKKIENKQNKRVVSYLISVTMATEKDNSLFGVAAHRLQNELVNDSI